jgi:purine nucleosidase
MTTKILLDTDIGSDIDDAVCLAYLLANPDAELLGITTVTGEATARAQMASALCKIGRVSIPIYPGAETPLLLIKQLQPRAPQASALERWSHDTEFPTGEAVEFLRRTIRQHPGEITLHAIGPLTNIALLFSVDAEIPRLLKEVVLMSGYFLSDAKFPEWNVKLDPQAAHIVYSADVPIRAIGLDVTLKVVMEADRVREKFSAPLLRPVVDFAEVWFRERPVITFHDPLAATTIFNPNICQFQRGTVTVEQEAGDRAGMTNWHPDPNGRHSIATEVVPDRFFEEFFSKFA